MTALQRFRHLVNDKFTDSDGNAYQITPKKGLTASEIGELAQHLPGQRLPDEIVELIRFSSGFEDDFFENFSFVNADGFGLEHFFPNVIELAGDGLGNFWLLDIDYQGNWGPVYYVCHDPAVIMKQAESLADFIGQIHDFMKDDTNSLFQQLYEQTAFKIWKLPRGGFISIGEAMQSGDAVLIGFAEQLPPEYLIADLRNSPAGAGFAWGKYYSVMDKELRYKDLPLWAVQPKKRGFFARLFGGR